MKRVGKAEEKERGGSIGVIEKPYEAGPPTLVLLIGFLIGFLIGGQRPDPWFWR